MSARTLTPLTPSATSAFHNTNATMPTYRGSSGGQRSGYQPNDPSAVVRRPAPCQFYVQGTCRNGLACRFSHLDIQQAAPLSSSNLAHASPDSRSTVLCRFFIQGACSKGGKCAFSHAGDPSSNVPLSATATGPLMQAHDEGASDALQPQPDDGNRQFYGALVTFHDGARVQKLTLASDFSAVRLDNLSANSTVASVVAAVSVLGFTVQPANVWKLPSASETSHSSYTIRMDDASFSKKLCEKAAENSAFDAVPVPAALPQSSGWCRVDCKKVLVSWYKPTKIAWLNFGNENIARKVSEKFSNGNYKILDRVVKSNGPTSTGGGRKHLAWTVTLTDVPSLAGEQDITNPLPSFWKPRHVEMGKPSYAVSDDVVFATVRSLLNATGPLEWWEAVHGSEGKRLKAKARFRDDADARTAFSSLDNKPVTIDTNDAIRLTVQLVHSTRLKVSNLVYEAVEEEIASHNAAWKARNLLFIPYSPIKGQRVLKIEGVESKQVAEAKQTLEKILTGIVAVAGEEVLWTSSFGSNGTAYDKVKKIGRDLGVVIIRNKRKRELRLYGSSTKIKEAERRLADHLEQVSSAAYTIFLDPQQFMWACKGGFKALVTALGDKVVAFDIVSSPKRITVTGSEKEYQEALAMVTSGDMSGSRNGVDTNTETLCATCWTEADDPVLTRCEHVYCTECFENLCFSGASEDTELAVSCKGNNGTCDVRFTLEELQEHLPTASLEDLLEASFKNYVRLHPHALSYCPTPDCKQIYRISAVTSRSLFTCTQCLTAICTSCRVDHAGRTCADDKFMRSGGEKELQATKKRLGIKDCPQCQTAMEKTYGCDHMTCGGCGTHICWNCMRHFGTSRECYDHMSKAHGGFGMPGF